MPEIVRKISWEFEGVLYATEREAKIAKARSDLREAVVTLLNAKGYSSGNIDLIASFIVEHHSKLYSLLVQAYEESHGKA